MASRRRGENPGDDRRRSFRPVRSASRCRPGALRLVEQGKLALDEDVNSRLVTWKVPENEFTKNKKVTLRGLLSHTAGLTVHGFPGYATDEPGPTLVQVLDGAKPANTRPIRVDILPGSKWRYSGGGYTVMQQLVVDVTGKPFPQFMHEAVLGPLDMKESTFEQPLPADKAKLTATGHHGKQKPVKGKWHIYPEMAAAGLWTTPSDLARFAIGVQEARRASPGKLCRQRWRGRCSRSRRTTMDWEWVCKEAEPRSGSATAGVMKASTPSGRLCRRPGKEPRS